MGKIITTGEEKAPRIICHNCKHQNRIDIRGWNKDVTMIGEIRCKHCRKIMYVGLLILADISVAALGNNVAAIVKLMLSTNVLKQGEEEPAIKLN